MSLLNITALQIYMDFVSYKHYSTGKKAMSANLKCCCNSPQCSVAPLILPPPIYPAFQVPGSVRGVCSKIYWQQLLSPFPLAVTPSREREEVRVGQGLGWVLYVT